MRGMCCGGHDEARPLEDGQPSLVLGNTSGHSWAAVPRTWRARGTARKRAPKQQSSFTQAAMRASSCSSTGIPRKEGSRSIQYEHGALLDDKMPALRCQLDGQHPWLSLSATQEARRDKDIAGAIED